MKGEFALPVALKVRYVHRYRVRCRGGIGVAIAEVLEGEGQRSMTLSWSPGALFPSRCCVA